jgi:hypothetical protein
VLYRNWKKIVTKTIKNVKVIVVGGKEPKICIWVAFGLSLPTIAALSLREGGG